VHSTEKGEMFEREIIQRINDYLPSSLYKVIANTTIEVLDGTTQIDIIVISPFGIFVIEAKNYSGYIYGSSKRKTWTQVLNRNSKYSFQNPLHQNYRHIKALAITLGLSDQIFHSIIVFNSQCKLKGSYPINIVQHCAVNTILSQEETLLTIKQQREVEIILNMVSLPKCQNTNTYHIESIKLKKAS
jgi:restriction system protein